MVLGEYLTNVARQAEGLQSAVLKVTKSSGLRRLNSVQTIVVSNRYY